MKLGSVDVPEEPKYDVEYIAEELQPTPQEEIEMPEMARVETNRAYNEAERYISDLESQRETPEETTEEKLKAIDDAISSSNNWNPLGKNTAKRKKQAEENNATKMPTAETTAAKGANRNTTISYRLVGRSALDLPNPVYTCEGFGKVVINITVDERGRVISTDYNESASTTTNGCLIDSAKEYAVQAIFSTKAGKKQQLGTISYNFPGQY